MDFIARRITNIPPSGIRTYFDIARTMPEAINLSIGQPDFEVPEPIKRAAVEAIRANRNGYSASAGVPELREAIGAALTREFPDWRPTIMVTCGVSGGLTTALAACLDSGDEVLFGDPYFVSYPYLVRLLGGEPVPVPLDARFMPDPERFAAAITPRTKIILLNSPSNPTGVVYERARVQAVAELARARDLLLISDEIYNVLSYDEPVPSPVSFAPERTLLLRGFGKSYGVTGWRLGYAAGPAELIEQMVKVQQYTFVCAPHMAQVAGVEALRTNMSAQVAAYRNKRDLVVAELSGAFEFVRPSGGFYIFPRVPRGFPDANAFVETAIARKVIVIPGRVFSRQNDHFRLSYAVPDARLREGCRILAALSK
ncbi:MAG TPA: aminotransferase class I/II-fold pyridoxal phosphate-dependent enzyme [Phycisphaerae bacterium]|jgi:aspartate aminotransferase/aminotransferase